LLAVNGTDSTLNASGLKPRHIERRIVNRATPPQDRRQKRYRATRPTFKLLEALKHRLKRTLKCAVNSKTRATRDLLGCSMDDFKIYLESKFEPGMSWGNYGYRGWHVDHIVPCALFDLSKPAHVRRCFHFSNLQPLWAQDNLRKGVQSSNQFNLL
jgi:hypothetical protein